MLKKIIATCCVVALAAGAVYAADTMQKSAPAAKAAPAAAPKAATAAAPAAAGKMSMASMKEMFSKCAVCKTMVPHMDSLGPVMKTEVAKLNDGVAMMHNITDPTKMAEFRTMDAEMAKAGMACQTMTDEQAKAQLCPYCQEMREIMKAGGHMSQGETKMGDIMVVTSTDPAVQGKITDLGNKCAMMAATM